jgi:hypothetical protein
MEMPGAVPSARSRGNTRGSGKRVQGDSWDGAGAEEYGYPLQFGTLRGAVENMKEQGLALWVALGAGDDVDVAGSPDICDR